MYLSDKDALQYASRLILILVPFFSSLFSTWSWLVEILILFAVFIHSRRSGLKFTVMIMLAGYLAALIPAGVKVVEIGFAPWAGVILLWLQQKGLPTNQGIFWSLLAAAVISVLPVVPMMNMVLQPDNIQRSIQDALALYEQQGTISALEAQGVSRLDFERYLQMVLPIYFKLLPAIAGILGMLEIGVGYWVYRFSIRKMQGMTPFILYRLPWYSVWVTILGLACYLGGDYLNLPLITTAGMNIMAMAAAMSLIIGISCLGYLFRHPKVPRIMFALLIVSILLFPSWIMITMLIVGLFDPVFNFRRIPEFNEGVKS